MHGIAIAGGDKPYPNKSTKKAVRGVISITTLERNNGRTIDVYESMNSSALTPLAWSKFTIEHTVVGADDLQIAYPRVTLRGHCLTHSSKEDTGLDWLDEELLLLSRLTMKKHVYSKRRRSIQLRDIRSEQSFNDEGYLHAYFGDSEGQC
ncbi:hypothetical protein EW146_g9495 [Bondarzewia mesenterica]|uniref:Uncharacterized protein n=1 Tax=Bondarzewia mesenterica TaxID=1095465 RepID=A0A4V3XCR0_9AGAM|nr:hypothetical protein EW146_g9495 [Bondarzewia mesenterica]